MAVFNRKCGGYKFKINDADHDPPHCHVNIGGKNTQIDIYTFQILSPPAFAQPPSQCQKVLEAVAGGNDRSLGGCEDPGTVALLIQGAAFHG